MMIRKSGLILVVIVPLAMGAWLYVARNSIVAGVATLALERMLGTAVRIEGVSLEPFAGRASFSKLRIADKHIAGQAMLEAGPAKLEVNGLQLFARKLVVRDLRLDGVAFGVPCAGCKPPPAPPAPPAKAPAPAGAPGGAPAAAAEPEDGGWTLKVPLPELNLDALEEKLDVGRLTSGQKLQSLQTLDRVEGESKARIASLQQRQDKLNAQPRLDEIKAQVNRLDFSSKDPRKLQESLAGLKDALAKTKALRGDVAGLTRDAKAEPGRLQADYAQVKGEVNADVAASMRLAKLGGLNLGQAAELLFGPLVMERFNWVLGQLRDVRAMLSSDGKPPAKPPRRAGRIIAFPVTGRVYPGFLLERTGFSGSAANPTGGSPLEFNGQLTGLSSDARVYGQPMRLAATASGKGGERWKVDGSFDHRENPGQDILVARGTGVKLSDVKLPGGALPERAVSKEATVTLQATLRGFALEAALAVDAKPVDFRFAEGPARSASQKAMRDVFGGIDQVQLQATVGGTLTHPRVKVSSNIDTKVSQGLQAVAGKRRAEAEAQVRAQIDAQVQARQAELQKTLQAQLAPLEAKVRQSEAMVQAYQEQLERKQADVENAAKAQARGKLDDVKQRLKRR